MIVQFSPFSIEHTLITTEAQTQNTVAMRVVAKHPGEERKRPHTHTHRHTGNVLLDGMCVGRVSVPKKHT